MTTSPLAATIGSQAPKPNANAKNHEATDGFFTGTIWILVLVPLVLTILLAALKKKKNVELPHATDMTWKLDVEEAEFPVVIHAYKAWSVGDRVIENQVRLLSERTEGRLSVLWFDIDRNPNVAGRFPTLERRSVALFLKGRLLWQVTGVHGYEDMLTEIALELNTSVEDLATREVITREEPVI